MRVRLDVGYATD